MFDEKNPSRFYASFISLCEKKGVSPTTAAKEADISKGAPTAWKKNGSVPKSEQRAKLCAYFGVTEDELLGYAIKKEPSATNSEGLHATKYDKLTDENKARIDDLIEQLLKSQSVD